MTTDKTKKPKKTVKKKKTKKAKSPFRGQRIIASILIVLVVIALAAVGTFSVYAGNIISGAPDLYVEDFIQPESTKIYDRDGEEIYDTGEKIRENITYDDLPQSLVDAFIAVEDSRFYAHNGFDVPRFTKAAIENLLDSLREGSVSFGQGGSTFTMQLIKGTYFTSENIQTGDVVNPERGVSGIDRKVQEIYLSQKIEDEQMLSKKLIFELYLNMINFGSGKNIVGVQNSAEEYFNKDVSELTLLESAFLAGVINAPSRNTPFNSINHATKRTHTVLNLMNLHGYITEDELALAKSTPLENIFVAPGAAEGEALPYQAFIDVVIDEVVEKTGNNPTVVPMKIYTTMDKTIQEGIDKFQRREIPELDQGNGQGAATHPYVQVGSSIINNANGEIIGIVGGYDYKGRLVFNRATAKSVQPASVIKPVVDYALAFEYLGYATTHVVVDEPWQYRGLDNKTVGNYDGQYKGEITIMDAVADSRNVPALKTLQAAIDTLGNSGVVEYLNKIGFSKITEENFNVQYAIGGNTFQTSPIEIAGAYTMIMNGGNYIEPHTVTRVEFSDGREPLDTQNASEPIISDSAAYLTTRTMKYAVEGPYPGFLRSVRKPYNVFAKTGTNAWGQDRKPWVPENSQRDRLMMASTDKFTMATWAGFDKYDKEEYQAWFKQPQADFNIAGKLNSYLLDLLQEEYGGGADIERPSGVVDIKHITGPFPYQSPLDGMNQSLISNGLIKKEFLNLTQAKPQGLKDLGSQSVDVKQSGKTLNFNIKLSAYPDKSKLSKASNTLTMTDVNGGKTYTGTRLYDDSWVFGAVQYKSEIRVNGNPVKEIITGNNEQRIDYPLTGNEEKIEVCSYYTYELSESRKSNSKCTSVDLSAIKVSGPGSNLFEDLKNWAESLGIPTSVNWQENNRLDQHMKVLKTDPNIINRDVNVKKLKKSGITMDVSEFVMQIQQGDKYSGNLKQTIDNLGQYMTLDISGNGNEISQVLVDGQVPPNEEIRLRNHKGKKLSITLFDPNADSNDNEDSNGDQNSDQNQDNDQNNDQNNDQDNNGDSNSDSDSD